MKVYSSRISNLNIKYETNGWHPLASPTLTTLPLTDKWTKCLQEFSGPGSRVGAIISNEHKLSPTSPKVSEDPIFTIGHLSPSSRESAEPPRHDPVLIIKTPAGEPGQWRANYRWWWPGHDCVSCTIQTPLPPMSRLIDASDIPSGSKAFIRRKLETRVGLPSVDRCQAASAQTCVTIIPSVLSSQKIIGSRVSAMSKLSLHDLWDTFMCSQG